MARSAKTRTDKTAVPQPPDLADEAPVAAPGESTVAPMAMSADADPSDGLPANALPDDALPASDPILEPAGNTGPTPTPQDMLSEIETPDAAGLSEQRPLPARDPTPPQTRRNEPPQRTGFLPLLLGGVIAALLGYAAAYLGRPQPAPDRTVELAATIAAQQDQLAFLENTLAELPPPVDISGLTTDIATAQAKLEQFQTEATGALAALDARLAEVEKTPNADGTLADTAIAAWEREMQQLRDDITAQQTRMQDIADSAAQQLNETRDQAVAIEQTATEAAADATARAALSRVQAALESGAPFQAALNDLSAATPIPDTLSALAADGVPTMLTLRSDFPAAARAALAVARSEGLSGEEGGGVMAFLRNQFDVRSVTPLEGSDVDAILSRTEDALRQNRLSDAMAELATLPEVVRAEMSDWMAAAEARASALAAVEGLSETLTQN